MTAAHWIAIAAIITPLISTWAQFWLKERSEKKKALAAASPATDQPKIAKRDSGSPETFWSAFRRNWRTVLIHYLANWVSTTVLLSIYLGVIPWTLGSGLLGAICVILIVLVNFVGWRVYQ